MDRVTFRITSRGQLITAFKHADRQAFPFIVEVRDVTRTDEQNKLLWACIDPWVPAVTLHGKHWTKDEWKAIHMENAGFKPIVLPSLDEQRWFAAGFRSSKIGKRSFSDLIESIKAEAAQRGVDLKGRVDEEG